MSYFVIVQQYSNSLVNTQIYPYSSTVTMKLNLNSESTQHNMYVHSDLLLYYNLCHGRKKIGTNNMANIYVIRVRAKKVVHSHHTNQNEHCSFRRPFQIPISFIGRSLKHSNFECSRQLHFLCTVAHLLTEQNYLLLYVAPFCDNDDACVSHKNK